MKALASCLLIIGLCTTSGGTVDLKTETIVLSDRIYPSIDLDAVASESRHPTKEWFKTLASRNRDLAADVTVQPLAEIAITRANPSDQIKSFEPFMVEAKRMAAQMGGNFLYLDKCISDRGQPTGLSFKVYRVEYRHGLLYPAYLAGGPTHSPSQRPVLCTAKPHLRLLPQTA